MQAGERIFKGRPAQGQPVAARNIGRVVELGAEYLGAAAFVEPDDGEAEQQRPARHAFAVQWQVHGGLQAG